MKLLIALAIVLVEGAVVFGANSDRGEKGTSSKIAVVQNAPQKFKPVYADKEDGQVFVQLKNDHGTTIFHQHVKNAGGFSRSYSLEQLPEGNYTFEITKPDGSIVYEKIACNSYISSADVSSPTFKADILNVNEKRFRLAVIKENTSPVQVNIYNEADQLVFSETVREEENFRKIYDLNQLKGETFRFDLKNKKYLLSMIAD